MTTYRYQYNTSLDCDNVVYYPSTLRNNKFPLHPHNFTFVKSTQNGDFPQNGANTQNGGTQNVRSENDRELVSLKLKNPQNELITFAIWGRLYVRDVNPVKDVTEEDVNSYIEIENVIYNHGDRQSTD